MNRPPNPFAIVVALLSLCGVLCAEPPVNENGKSAEAVGADADNPSQYVDAKAAGYLDKNLREIQTKGFQLLAHKKPPQAITKLRTARQWEKFLAQYGGKEVRSGKALSYQPDFRRELMVALFVDTQFRGDDFTDIELWVGDNALRGYVFHGYSFDDGGTSIASDNKQGKQGTIFRGCLYLATVPLILENKPMEFRLGFQSWGRVCSRFSPCITQVVNDEQEPRERVGLRTPRELFMQYFTAMALQQRDEAQALKANDCSDTLHMNIDKLNVVARLQPFYQCTTSDRALVIAQPFTIFKSVRDEDEIIYAEFRKLDGDWRIQELARTEPRNISWLMKGFQLHPESKLDLTGEAFVGRWWYPCDSDVVMRADGTGSELVVGPGGPESEQPTEFTWSVKGNVLRRKFANKSDQLIVRSIDHNAVRFAKSNTSFYGGWNRRESETEE